MTGIQGNSRTSFSITPDCRLLPLRGRIRLLSHEVCTAALYICNKLSPVFPSNIPSNSLLLYIFIREFSTEKSEGYGFAGAEEVQDSLADGQAEDAAEGIGIGIQLDAVALGPCGDLLLPCHAVGFIVDDD